MSRAARRWSARSRARQLAKSVRERTLLSLVFIPLLVSAGAWGASEDWPRLGGPRGTGSSEETGWQPRGKVIWTAEVGQGRSSCVARAGRVFTFGFVAARSEHVVSCLDGATGKTLWTSARAVEAPAPEAREAYLGTLSTPTVDGDQVFVSDTDGTLRCLREADGELLWELEGKKLKLDVPRYGFSSSPLALGERAILNYGRVFAFERDTGKTLWRSKKDYGDAYSTPVELGLDGMRFVAVFAAKGLAILAEEDGSERDFVPWKTRDDVNAPTPLVLGTRVFVSSGYGRGCALIELSGKKPKILWESPAMSTLMHGAVAWGDGLYGFGGDALECVDLTGAARWREEEIGGSGLSIVGGRLLFGSTEGELVVAEATPTAYRELGRTKGLGKGAWAFAPAFSGGLCFLRDLSGRIAAFDLRE